MVFHAYGGPEVLALEQVAEPTIGERDVLIRVRAASLNSWDRAQVIPLGLWAKLTSQQRVELLLHKANHDLAYLGELAAAGQLTPVIEREYSLSIRAADRHAAALRWAHRRQGGHSHRLIRAREVSLMLASRRL